MSTGEHKPEVSQDAKPASQPTPAGDVLKITSQNIPQSQPQRGSGIVKAQGE